jgi:DNA-binding winged helix-turn-helix (wHTH) protein/tetratricopeptide (TPR) repeat protein
MSQGTIYRFGDFLLCPATREFSRGDEPLVAPARVFDCLVYLIEHRTRAVGRDELGAAVWGRVDVSEAQLTQAILRARRLLGEGSGEPSCIRTVPRFGYHWACEVTVEQVDAVLRDAAAESRADPPAFAPQHGVVAAGAAPSDEVAAAAQIVAGPGVRARSRWLPWAVLLAFIAVIGFGVWASRPQPPPQGQVAATPVAGILVLPVEITAGGEHAWVRLGAMDVIAERLRATGLAVAPSETTLALLGAGASEAGPAGLSRRTGAAWVISSRAVRSALGWRVGLTATDAKGTEYSATSEAGEVLAAFRASADGLLGRMGLNAPLRAQRDPALDETVQRAQAAMLENDLQAAQKILTGASLSAAAQPELRYQLAALAFRTGRLDEAEREFRGLLDDESAADAPLLRARVHFALGAIAMMRDRAAEAEPAFEAALQSLDRKEHLLEYGKALSGRGGARLTLGQVQQGLDDLGEARVLLEQAGDRLALARTLLVYGVAQLMRDRPGPAADLLAEAIAQLEPFGAINERAHGYSALVNAALALLDYDRAARASAAAWTLLPRLDDPLNRSETIIDRATLLLAQGHRSEAAPVFAELDALDLADHARLDGRRDALHARLAWDRSDAQAALAPAAAAISKLAASEPDSAAESVLLRQRALLALGRRDEAAAALRAVPTELMATLDGRMPLGLRLARAELAANTGDTAASDREYAAAQADAEARDVPAQTLLVAVSMLPYLLAHDRLDAASALIGRLPEAAEQDFDGVLLQVRLHQALGHSQPWTEALQRARALAGERSIPPELQSAPLAAGLSGGR